MPPFLFRKTIYYNMLAIGEKISLAFLKKKIHNFADEVDNIIKFILPHTGDFKKEVKFLSRKKEIFVKIDELVKKYDKAISKLESD